MKRNLLFGTVLSAALAAGVAAQGSGTATGQSSSRTQDQPGQITVTGCLQNADMAGAGAAAGTSGTGSATSGGQSSAAGGAQFMLTNATMAKMSTSGTSGSATSGTGTSGSATSGTSASGTAGTAGGNRFLLVGGNQQNLKQYLNSQVEVHGRLDQSKGGTGATGSTASGTGSTASGTGSATAGQSGQSSSRMGDAQRLTVTSVRQIASTCSGR